MTTPSKANLLPPESTTVTTMSIIEPSPGPPVFEILLLAKSNPPINPLSAVMVPDIETADAVISPVDFKTKSPFVSVICV